ncbi:MAG: hypothetical protein LBP59_05060 [Planctomycetaceae bacterium]|jgi:hypothetical protein|nr:hypothetical protein [Planctomycetaceae bacterium]
MHQNISEIRSGLYAELGVLGFAKNSSSALEEKVARAVALYPSLELSQRELAATGLDLDIKEIRRIAMQCGESILTLRLLMLQEYLDGKLESTGQLAGQSMVISVDGGYTRLWSPPSVNMNIRRYVNYCVWVVGKKRLTGCGNLIEFLVRGWMAIGFRLMV